jgi:hypothetical protein
VALLLASTFVNEQQTISVSIETAESVGTRLALPEYKKNNRKRIRNSRPRLTAESLTRMALSSSCRKLGLAKKKSEVVKRDPPRRRVWADGRKDQ